MSSILIFFFSWFVTIFVQLCCFEFSWLTSSADSIHFQSISCHWLSTKTKRTSERAERWAQRHKLARDQWNLCTSVKYDRAPSKSTWQADGQVQDFTSNEKNDPALHKQKFTLVSGLLHWWLTDGRARQHGFCWEKRICRFQVTEPLSWCEGFVDVVALSNYHCPYKYLKPKQHYVFPNAQKLK